MTSLVRRRPLPPRSAPTTNPAELWTGLPLQTQQLGTVRGYVVWLLRAVSFECDRRDGRRRIVHVPAEWVTDLTSMYREGPWSPAAVIHDYLYARGACYLDRYGALVRTTRNEADYLFLRAMQSLGIPRWRCRLLYLGVRAGGWLRWRRARRIQAANRDARTPEAAK